MFEKIYSIESSSSIVSILGNVVIALIIVISAFAYFKSRRPQIKKIAIAILAVMAMGYSGLILGFFINDYPSGNNNTAAVFEVNGNITVSRECSYLAGSLPGEFRVGEKFFEYGLNSKNYEITDIVKSLHQSENEQYRIKYDQEDVILEIWRKR